jgi:hypothetical protein
MLENIQLCVYFILLIYTRQAVARKFRYYSQSASLTYVHII